MALALVALLVPRVRARGPRALVVALVLSTSAAAVPLVPLLQARALPLINDITTDTANPPAFVAILPLRAAAPVPAGYAGETAASAQRAAYPDIVPIVVAKAPGVAFDAALAAVLRVPDAEHWLRAGLVQFAALADRYSNIAFLRTQEQAAHLV